MSDTAAETKETPVAQSPEKEEVCCPVKKPGTPAKGEAAKEEQANGKEHAKEQNGDAKEAEPAEEEKNGTTTDAVNGDAKTDACPLPQKRKSEVASDSTDSAAPKDGASPEKKAKLEEKSENGEAEATA